MNENLTENKRTSERRRIFYYLEVEDTQTKKPLGRIGDVSANGIMLLTSQALPLNTKYSIGITIPDSPELKSHFPSLPQDRVVKMSVITRWKKADHNPSITCIGCQVVDDETNKQEVSSEASRVFEQLIQYYGFSDGYKQFRQLYPV